jgi:peptidoglycan/xylan/chitin deacetylase (PgdA/CDA1 family)
MKLRQLVTTAFMAVILFASGQAHCEPLPTIALTFDHYRSTYDVAFPIMKRHGLVGTYYVEARFIDAGIPVGTTSDELREMQHAGWEIGAYSAVSLYPIERDQGEAAARDVLTNISNKMAAKGFPATSLAAAGRAWSKPLVDISEPLFGNVRVIELRGRQGKIENPHYVRNGWMPTLSAADTAQSLERMVSDLISKGGLQTVVIHEVGNESNPGNSVSSEAFGALCSVLAKQRDQGRLIATTFSAAVELWRAK